MLFSNLYFILFYLRKKQCLVKHFNLIFSIFLRVNIVMFFRNIIAFMQKFISSFFHLLSSNKSSCMEQQSEKYFFFCMGTSTKTSHAMGKMYILGFGYHFKKLCYKLGIRSNVVSLNISSKRTIITENNCCSKQLMFENSYVHNSYLQNKVLVKIIVF